MKFFYQALYVLAALFTVSYVFNHYDPWLGVLTGVAFIAISINYLTKTKK